MVIKTPKENRFHEAWGFKTWAEYVADVVNAVTQQGTVLVDETNLLRPVLEG